ncbi:MAG: hypothetical protein AAFW84_02825 [Cyanobacteria bacterium J06635_15]
MSSLISKMSYQPLLHVLSHPTQAPQGVLSRALQGRHGQEIVRAEIELKKVTKALSIMAGGTFNDPTMLTTLSLPGNADAVLWVAYMLFDQAQQLNAGGYSIQKRNRDCHMLLDALAQLKIGQWYEAMVTPIQYASSIHMLQFPATHPQPNGMYRQHLLPIYANHYYPVDSYFVYMFEERKRELLQTLADLGATKITIQAHDQNKPSGDSLNEQVFEFSGKPWSNTLVFDQARYNWLPYDSRLQSLVDSRLHHGLNKAKFEINLDVDNILFSRFREIETFLSQMESLDVTAMATLLQKSLRPQTVIAEFVAQS